MPPFNMSAPVFNCYRRLVAAAGHRGTGSYKHDFRKIPILLITGGKIMLKIISSLSIIRLSPTSCGLGPAAGQLPAGAPR